MLRGAREFQFSNVQLGFFQFGISRFGNVNLDISNLKLSIWYIPVRSFCLLIGTFLIWKFSIWTFPTRKCSIFKGSTFKFSILRFRSSFSKFQIYRFQNCKDSENACRPSNNFRISDHQIWKNLFFKDGPICFLYFWKYVGNKYGARGSRVDNIFGRSRNVLKKYCNRSGIIN